MSDMNSVITVDTITKYYRTSLALYNVSFSLEKGHIYGLLGPNGAGKSTLCSILATSLFPDTGEINYFSHKFSRSLQSELTQIRSSIGYLPQSPVLPPQMTVQEFLLFMGSAKGLLENDLYQSVNRVLEEAEISEYSSSIISTLSSGSYRRVALASVIINHPDLLILDEPSASLDPEQNLTLRNIITARRQSDKITLISSHNLHEIESLCDRFIILSEGKILKMGSLDNLRGADGVRIKITLASPCNSAKNAIEKLPHVTSCKCHKNVITVDAVNSCSIERVSAAVTDNGGIIVGFSTNGSSLEDTYFGLLSK